jgi:hypothetical protein
MLENLPVSPETDSMAGSIHEHDQGFHDDTSCTGLKELKSSCDSKSGNISDIELVSDGCQAGPGQPGTLQLDCELARRRCIRDSYGKDSNPDSGIGGMACDNSTSLSGESVNTPTDKGNSGKSVKTFI